MVPQPEISKTTGKPKHVRQDNGREAAKAEATMTKDEWKHFQTPAYQKKWAKPEYMLEKKPLVHVRDGGEGAYRDQTYEIVTRWTEDTKIEYRPHAKAPGSKSHVRYEKYSAATTVGEALTLGSYPMDWCFDYEHGFIKVVGGITRDDAIDPSQVDDVKQLTEVDKVIMNWYKRELAKKYGLKIQDLSIEKGQGENLLIRAHRLVANRLATQYLEAAERAGRAIMEEEVESTLSHWGFQRNAARTNVFPDGKEWVWSDNMGLVRDRVGDIHLTYSTTKYASTLKLLAKYLTDRLQPEVDDFRFTSLNLNCNYAAKRHRDGNNFGPSIIKGFGDYTGGELSSFPNDDKSKDLESLPAHDKVSFSIKENLCMFNGNSAHEVSSFTGKRFSVVYFTASCHAKAKEEDKAKLAELGFRYPSSEEDPFRFLAKPAGYKGPPKAVSGVPKQLKLFPVSTLDKQLKLGHAKPGHAVGVKRKAAECVAVTQ